LPAAAQTGGDGSAALRGAMVRNLPRPRPLAMNSVPNQPFHSRSDRRLRRSGTTAAIVLAASALFLVQPGCSDNYYNSYYYGVSGGAAGEEGGARAGSAGSEGGAGSGAIAGTGGGAGQAGAGQGGTTEYPGAPIADTSVDDHQLDLFGAVGSRFWLAISDEQLELVNEESEGGPIIDVRVQGGDPYSPNGDTANFVDHLWITTTGENGQTADYGRVQVKLAGQSTRRAWNARSIPNLNLDADEFVEHQRIGSFEHLRLNNAQVGSIFRDHLALELFRRLGYPAPLSTFVWVSSNVWGSEISIPFVLVERYKRTFCNREKDALGDGCANMWEFSGDFARGRGTEPLPIDQRRANLPIPSLFDEPENCQIDECETERVKELESLLSGLPLGEGFKAKTEDWIDWPSFHRFQCLSWIVATGDDALHNQNNVVLVERKDGKFQYLPYSVDISLGQDWFATVPLAGQSVLARGCQSDAACWADTISACEDLITEVTELDPAALLDELHETLSAAGMLRKGDDRRYTLLREWLKARVASLPDELEENRVPPVVCEPGQIDCGGYCAPPDLCGGSCIAPVGRAPLERELGEGGAGGSSGEPAEGGAGGSGSSGGECPPISVYGVQ
jgi:hypothetical protein